VFRGVFQAEDGIRDRDVTGVQTCALPILYIVEQARKDSYNTSKKEVSLTFKEKYKPKTSYQLDELRRYGL